MNSLPKVVGLVQANNEWPLLALSISNALMYHVDEVYVLNHCSTDGSFKGLQHLNELWKNRIHVLSCHDESYLQEASTNVLIVVTQSAPQDWIYVFDADEFLLTQGHRPLKEILGDVDPEYAAVSYEVQNWISTGNFDETHLDHFRMLRYRSVPNLFLYMREEIYADEIRNGNLNFYDVPFPSKVIFRNDTASWLAAGAHGIKSPAGANILSMDADELRGAHFPFLDKKRLGLKVRQGQLLIQHGFPAYHGWQNQMIYRLSQDDKLEQFWEAHSITPHNDSSDRTLPSYVIDDGFVQAIEPVLCLLEEGLDSRILQKNGEPDLSTGRSDDTQIPFRTAVQLTRKFQLIADSVRRDGDAIITERNAIVTQRDTLVTERDAIVTQRDALVAERDTLVNQRNALVTECDAILNSRTWRYTRFLRVIRGWFAHAGWKKV